jgi:hypothetical protein
MANNLSDIVNVNIDIAAPAVDSASFDNLLIFGPGPLTPPVNPLPEVGVYSSLLEVADAGYVTVGEMPDPVGVAARIAFSQNPRPARIFIAPIRPATPAIADAELDIITEDNWQTAQGVDPDGDMPADLPWLQVTYGRQSVSSMEVEILKDGVSVFGKSLPTEFNLDAYLQVVIGSSADPYADQMNIPDTQEAGEYTVILTSAQGARRTVITAIGTFDGTSIFTPGPVDADTVPSMLNPVEVLDAALTTTGWYVACAAGIDQSWYEQVAQWTEAQTKLFTYTFLQREDPVGQVYFRSFGVCGLINDFDIPGEEPEANRYLHIAMTAKCLAYPAGSETWAFKQLAAVFPSQISSTLRKMLTEGHSNFFTRYAGRNITMNGQVRGGEWIDVIRGRDWLQNDMQLRLFNLLLMNPKIPYTNGGIALVQNEMIASLKAATDRGIVAPDEYDENNQLVPGFTTRVPNSMTLTATQKASRVLEGCTFRARLAGAIHVIDVRGTLTY